MTPWHTCMRAQAAACATWRARLGLPSSARLRSLFQCCACCVPSACETEHASFAFLGMQHCFAESCAQTLFNWQNTRAHMSCGCGCGVCSQPSWHGSAALLDFGSGGKPWQGYGCCAVTGQLGSAWHAGGGTVLARPSAFIPATHRVELTANPAQNRACCLYRMNQ